MEEDYLEQLVMENTSLSSQMREYLYVEMSHGVKVSNLAEAVARELGEDEEFAGILLWQDFYMILASCGYQSIWRRLETEKHSRSRG